MSSVIRSLIWKESVERRASLGLGIAWVVGGTLYALADEAYFRVRAPLGTFYAVCLLYGFFAPVFLAMRTCLGEQTLGTLAFTSSLPTSRRLVACVRLSGAIATLVCPIVVGAFVLSLALGAGWVEQVPPRSDVVWGTSQITVRPALPGIEAVGLTWKVVAVSVAAATELLLILSVMGVRRRSEAHVGLLGAVLASGWLLSTELPRTFQEGALLQHANGRISAWTAEELVHAMKWLGAVLPESLLSPASYSGPTGSYQELEFADRVWGPLLINVLVLLMLAALFVRRYGVLRSPSARFGFWSAWSVPPLFSHLPIRWRGRRAALVWIDLRQSVPIAVAGFALAVLITVAGVLIKPLSPYERVSQVGAITLVRLPGTISVVALLWSGIVASVAFSSELQTGLWHFWRSRPIPVSMWFWIKFVVGLLAVVVVLDGLPAILSPRPPEGSLDASSPNRMSGAYLACMPLLHGMLYALAVFAVCRLRRSVLAVVCSFVPFLLLSVVVEEFPMLAAYGPVAVYDQLCGPKPPDLTAHHYPVVYGTVAAIIVLAAVASSRAVHRWSAVADS